MPYTQAPDTPRPSLLSVNMDSQETTPSPSGHPSFDDGQRPMPQPKSLEPVTSITPPKGSKVSRYLNGRIKPTFYAECQLILLTFCIGLQGEPPPPTPFPSTLN